jgi:NNP family nitrate/nitrite transporter-like MFS transporter
MFAFAQNFEQAALSRFLLGFIGAGFVVGIHMVSEWFPVHELGTAEGIYGGWGKFWLCCSYVFTDSRIFYFRCLWC